MFIYAGAVISQPHPDTRSWYDRAIANGGIISTASFDVCNQLVLDCIDKNIWFLPPREYTLMLPLIGSNLAAAITPLYYPAHGTGIVPIGLADANWLETFGLNPGAGNTNKYLNLGVIASNLCGLNSARIAIRSQTNVSATQIDVGARGASTSSSLLFQSRNPTGQAFFQCWSNSANGTVTSPSSSVPTSVGITVASRSSGVNSRLYKTGSLLASIATNAGTPANQNIFAFCFNNNGVPANFSSRTLSHIQVDNIMANDKELDFYNIIIRKETALGRA